MATPSATTLQMFSRVFTRAFHASSVTSASRARLKGLLEDVPPYPFQIKHTFKQSWFGLYGGKHIQFGNNVGRESNFKTRRRWLPNIRHKSLWSQALGKAVELDVTANVLRTIDKVGGLDKYLLGAKSARLKELGPMGWALRWKIMNTPWYKKQMQTEMEALGLTETTKPTTEETPVAASVVNSNP
ncbi:hypothetical protein FN846DRAFT_976739 [Sphaerosporella brunnea]|uniref:Large ribosomal subunit protein bL28m n=1 Tax=Sphaerosporella brunnea TaxID=1250544 RepID=A0A5J5EFM8_9PEZI|nr:hypothetical protein FN846DRAFT_976739 [Sphaerosporella brunnea]